MRYSRRKQLCQLMLDNSGKHEHCVDDVQPLHLSENDLDKKLASTSIKVGVCKTSLLKYLDIVKQNDPLHKKRKTNQSNQKARLISTNAMSHVMIKVEQKKARNSNVPLKEVACSYNNINNAKKSVSSNVCQTSSKAKVKLDNSENWPPKQKVSPCNAPTNTKLVNTHVIKNSSTKIKEIENEESDYLSTILCMNTDELITEKTQNSLCGVGPKDEAIAELNGNSVNRKSMTRLPPGLWLNDEIINFYMSLLAQRDQQLSCTK